MIVNMKWLLGNYEGGLEILARLQPGPGPAGRLPAQVLTAPYYFFTVF